MERVSSVDILYGDLDLSGNTLATKEASETCRELECDVESLRSTHTILMEEYVRLKVSL